MDKEHAKGAFDKAKGEFKETVGEATNDDELRGEGKLDKAKGKAREIVGDAKDAVEKAVGRADRKS